MFFDFLRRRKKPAAVQRYVPDSGARRAEPDQPIGNYFTDPFAAWPSSSFDSSSSPSSSDSFSSGGGDFGGGGSSGDW